MAGGQRGQIAHTCFGRIEGSAGQLRRDVFLLAHHVFSVCNFHSFLYRGLNCPNRHPKPSEDTELPIDEKGGRTLALEFINFEDGFVFVFLSVIIIATFFASVFICGALFTNKGVKRPLNQVSTYLLFYCCFFLIFFRQD